MTGQARQAPGVVKVRLLGAAGDIAAVADLLTIASSRQPPGLRSGTCGASAVAFAADERDASASAARDALRAAGHDASTATDCGDWQVIDRSAPYPNRRDPGARLYLTLAITTSTGGPRDA